MKKAYLCAIMQNVKPKKQLGQHFLTSQKIAKDIVDALTWEGRAVEIGPGMGVLSRYLFERPDLDMRLVEVDQESVDYLKAAYSDKAERVIWTQAVSRTHSRAPLLCGRFARRAEAT